MMKSLRVSFHSIVDVITNSSTVIYTACTGNAVEYMKEIVNSVLKAGGSDKKADDLYVFSVAPGGIAQDNAADYISENPESVGKKEGDEIGWKECSEIVKKMLEDWTLDAFLEKHGISGHEYYPQSSLAMKCKTPEGEDFMNKIAGLFESDGERDG